MPFQLPTPGSGSRAGCFVIDSRHMCDFGGAEYGDREYTPVTVSLLAAVVLGRVLGLCKAHRMSVIGRNGRFEEFGAW